MRISVVNFNLPKSNSIKSDHNLRSAEFLNSSNNAFDVFEKTNSNISFCGKDKNDNLADSLAIIGLVGGTTLLSIAAGVAMAKDEDIEEIFASENGYIIDLDEIPEEIARRAKLIIVSYPNNPTTAVAPPEFYRKLIAFAKKYDIWVLHDNAYSELVFDGVYGGSFLAYEGAREVGVEFNSLSKTYGLAGARIGFCVGNRELVGKLAKLKSNTDYGMFIPFQKAAAAAITGDQSCVITTREAYEHRRNVLCDSLTAIGWPVNRSPSTMFVWAKIPEKFDDSETFAMELVRRAGVIVTPGSAFGPSGRDHVRLALVQDEDKIHEAVAAIRESGILD